MIEMHMTYFMNVETKYFNLLRSGEKTIELRLYDDKRRQIKIGDEIVFAESGQENNTFSAQVIALHLGADFTDLCRRIDCQQAGFATNDELIAVLEEFYPLSRQKQFGVVGIEVKIM